MSITSTVGIDSNQRLNPLLEKINGFREIFKSDQTERIVNAAIPLFSLFPGVQSTLSLQMGGLASWKISQDAFTHYQQGAYKTVCHDFSRLTWTVLTVAFYFFLPRFTAILGEGVKITEKVAELGSAAYHLEGKQAALKLLAISHSIIYMSSLMLAAPEVIAISLLAQCVLELYESTQDYLEGRWIEAAAKLTLSTVRIIGAASLMPQVYLAYEKFRNQQLAKRALYNEPKDHWMIMAPKQKIETQHHTFYPLRQYFDFWGGEYTGTFIAGQSSVLDVKSENGKGQFFYTYIKLPEGNRGIAEYGSMAGQYLDFIQQETNIQIDRGAQTCRHLSMGEGYWDLRHEHEINLDWTQENRGVFHSLALSIYFGDQNSPEWFQTTKDMQVKKREFKNTSSTVISIWGNWFKKYLSSEFFSHI